MAGYPLGVITLVIVFLLIYFGLAHRVLDRLYLSDRAGLALVAAMIAGSFINIPLLSGPITTSINVGGGLIPIGLAVYVLYRAGTAKEVWRALAAAAVTAAAVFFLNSVLMPTEPWNFALNILDPLYYYPLVAGIVAYLVGRSRRAAFIAAILGILALDVIDFFRLLAAGVRGTVAIGGGGIFDITILAGVVAVLLAELVGEARERLQGGPEAEGRPRSLLASLKIGQARKLLNEDADKKRGGQDE
ncbi:MAG: hypothetical protein PWP65_1206 [Clostridia bacterium]|nr:hypothetical protein [Clostridia bacterium]